MTPDARFVQQPKAFWAHVRSISQECGYTVPRRGVIKVPSLEEACGALHALGLQTVHVSVDGKTPSEFGGLLIACFQHRADVLNNFVEPRLMDAKAASRLFHQLQKQYNPPRDIIPMNKQEGTKKTPAYMTAIINILVRAHAGGIDFDHDPRSLTTITTNGQPLRTLARRVDGAFPSVVNPVAIWEVKEYYHKTTFGSRVADGVYETLLDGMELEELREHERINVKHYLMVDAHYTWWKCGRSYLCRIIDMLHMGYVGEVLFGKEVIERLPIIVPGWVKTAKERDTKPAVPGGGDEPKPEGHIPVLRS